MTGYPVNIYLFKFNNRNTRKRCGICSELIIKTPEHVNDVVLVFLLLTLTYFIPFSSVSTIEFGQVNASWVTVMVAQVHEDLTLLLFSFQAFLYP